MTLQWTLAAGFLYAEIGVLLLFCLPFISPSRWNQIFKSRFVSAISEYGNFYFNVIVIVMVLLLADSLREIYKYNKVDVSHMDLKNNPQAETLIHMKMFRAQRNLYISGFSLFLLVVLRRVIRLIARLSVSEASAEASIKQAKSASDQCQRLMAENDKLEKKLSKEDADANEEEEISDEMNKLKKELQDKKEELSQKIEDLDKTKKDLSAFKEQAQGVTREYDRLLEEHSKIQVQY
ncbi:hypothetical protein QZH41_017924 [Actinostola sp. cb2023]|nr:hypothetical protein QZH41_017924 [Actinostola sp. cb2023]